MDKKMAALGFFLGLLAGFFLLSLDWGPPQPKPEEKRPSLAQGVAEDFLRVLVGVGAEVGKAIDKKAREFKK